MFGQFFGFAFGEYFGGPFAGSPVVPPVDLPDAVDFGNVPDATADTIYESNIVTLTGFVDPLALSLPAGGQMRIDGGAYGSGPASVNPGQTLQLKTTALHGAGQAQNIAVYAGGEPWGAWTVVTQGSDFIKGCKHRRAMMMRAIRVLKPVQSDPSAKVDPKA